MFKQMIVDQAGRCIVLRHNGQVTRQSPTEGPNPALVWEPVDLTGVEGRVEFITTNPTQSNNLVVLTGRGTIYQQYRGRYQTVREPMKWRQIEEPIYGEPDPAEPDEPGRAEEAAPRPVRQRKGDGRVHC